MKVLSSAQIRELDDYTIGHGPISSIDLMERAVQNCLIEEEKELSFGAPVLIVCGKGNNGGDGLALARMLAERQVEVTVAVLEYSPDGSPDFTQNLKRLEEQAKAVIVRISEADEFPSLRSSTRIYDAILGSGLNRPLEGLLAEVVRKLNSLNNHVTAIDMPTGLFAEDNQGNSIETVVHAQRTLTFHCPKLSLLLHDFGICAGDIRIVDIGLMEKQTELSSPFELVESDALSKLRIHRDKFSYKGNFGHALLLAGSKGKMGAAQLAAKACLRSGAGLLTVHVSACGTDIMQTTVQEAMCSEDADADHISELPDLTRFNAIGIGPGMGQHEDTARVLKRLLQDAKVPLVIDADGLNLLSQNKTWQHFLPAGTVLTPHLGEFERLVGSTGSAYQRLQMQMEFSKKFSVVMVLKGAHTCTTTPAGQVFFNNTGNPGMATAGSGDVLTGIILGLLAQHYSPEVAAVLGVHLHGAAADAAMQKQSYESLIAGDIIANLGNAFRQI